ncbi:MAG: 50S ribosomal protein L23 [Syntrophomonas sp.]|uniref:50S ribosomal protein L23 n=1 Tax=Syntrophomonas sp. TaxID=2053627 RepID=UPI0026378539|nr:50S ribosomal protein L23 [Syntrophomonas sp.]MDD2509594.1 50S ribosomal protein L23 [Syntrophomonas sp.]MDD3880487.1 50S ribosomal protein L23 [Syntrophomonas sp.]MDD4626241.1 50S ribosomal protein L23 [Syntrophomonas sp.]
MKDYRDIIIKPVVTEKSMNMLADNKYTFIVDKRANKTEIKNAIENIFEVRVESINTINVKGKPKRMGRFEGKKPDRKKAVISLKPGQKIRLFEGM